jgi:hypothetical protein
MRFRPNWLRIGKLRRLVYSVLNINILLRDNERLQTDILSQVEWQTENPIVSAPYYF